MGVGGQTKTNFLDVVCERPLNYFNQTLQLYLVGSQGFNVIEGGSEDVIV